MVVESHALLFLPRLGEESLHMHQELLLVCSALRSFTSLSLWESEDPELLQGEVG